MSIEALHWANEQEAATPAAQFVLEKLAWWAGPQGVVLYADPDYIAKKTRMSRATVFRHLSDFQAAGILTRTRQKADDGSVQHGAILHLEKRLIYERDASEKPEMAAEANSTESHHETPVSPCDSEIESHHETPVSPCDSDQSHDETPSYLENLSKKNLSLSEVQDLPRREREKVAAPENQKSEDEEADTEEAFDRRWEKFIKAYPFTMSMPRVPARRALKALAIRDQMKAIRWAGEYREACKRDGRRLPKDADNWLKNREFDELGLDADAKAQEQGLKHALVFVRKDSEGWKAWEKVKLRLTGLGSMFAVWSKAHEAYGADLPSVFPVNAPASGGRAAWEAFREGRATGPPPQPSPQQVEETIEF